MARLVQLFYLHLKLILLNNNSSRAPLSASPRPKSLSCYLQAVSHLPSPGISPYCLEPEPVTHISSPSSLRQGKETSATQEAAPLSPTQDSCSSRSDASPSAQARFVHNAPAVTGMLVSCQKPGSAMLAAWPFSTWVCDLLLLAETHFSPLHSKARGHQW